MKKFSCVSTVDWSICKQKRAGIIFTYTDKHDRVLYCLGVDRRHKEYTDFGGSRKKTDNDLVSCAIRECYEETLNLIDIDINDIKDSPVLFGENMVFIFYHLSETAIFTLIDNFFHRRSSLSYTENKAIVVITKYELAKLLRGKKVRRMQMYPSIVKELRDIGFKLDHFTRFLDKMIRDA